MDESLPATQDTGHPALALGSGMGTGTGATSAVDSSEDGTELKAVPAHIVADAGDGQQLPCLLYYSPVQTNGYGASQQYALQMQLVSERTGAVYAGVCVLAGVTPEDRKRHADALHTLLDSGILPRDVVGTTSFHITQTEASLSLAVAFRRQGQGEGVALGSGSRSGAVRWTMAAEAVRSHRDDGRLPYSWGDGWLHLLPLPGPLSALYPSPHTDAAHGHGHGGGKGQAALARQLQEAQSVGTALISQLLSKLLALSTHARLQAGRVAQARQGTAAAQEQARALQAELEATIHSRVQERAETSGRMVLFVNRKKEEVRALQMEVGSLRRQLQEGEKRERKAALDMKKLQADLEAYKADAGGGAAAVSTSRSTTSGGRGKGRGMAGAHGGTQAQGPTGRRTTVQVDPEEEDGAVKRKGAELASTPRAPAPVAPREVDMDEEDTDMEDEGEEGEGEGEEAGSQGGAMEEEELGEEGEDEGGSGSAFHKGALRAYSSQVWPEEQDTDLAGTATLEVGSGGSGGGGGVARAAAAARGLLSSHGAGYSKSAAQAAHEQAEEEEEEEQFI